MQNVSLKMLFDTWVSLTIEDMELGFGIALAHITSERFR